VTTHAQGRSTTIAVSRSVGELRSAERSGAPSPSFGIEGRIQCGCGVCYLFRPHIGVGFGVMFSHASVPLDDTLTVDAGGARAGGGLRVGF
jgi:hypothetical protein